MFLLCSEDYFGAQLVAGCDASIVFQTLWGSTAVADFQARATLEYAVLHEGVRHVIVMAHRGCRSTNGAPAGGAHEQAFAQWQWLTNDEFSRSLLCAHGVQIRLLWVDAPSGEVCNWRADQQRLEPMPREAFERMLASMDEPSS